jgi:hypothetical protein
MDKALTVHLNDFPSFPFWKGGYFAIWEKLYALKKQSMGEKLYEGSITESDKNLSEPQ